MRDYLRAPYDYNTTWKLSNAQGNFIIKEAVSTMMSFWGAPFKLVHDRWAAK